MKQYRGYLKLLTGFAVLIMSGILSGCESMEKSGNTDFLKTEKEVFAMDTYMTVTGYGENSMQAVDEAIAEIKKLDEMFSVENTEGELFKLNRDKHIDSSDELKEIIALAAEYEESTKGALDITIYPVMKLWGFYGENTVPSAEQINEELRKVDYRNILISDDGISIKGDGEIELGAVAKGYTSEKIRDIFKKYGLRAGIVSLGGNVQFWGQKPEGGRWKCAIKNPKMNENKEEYLGVMTVDEKAVVTTGTYERYFVDQATGIKYHHVFNPKTGYPADNQILSVTVIAEDSVMADALSTALFVMGKDKAVEYWHERSTSFDMILMMENETIIATDNLRNSFETKYKCEWIE